LENTIENEIQHVYYIKNVENCKFFLSGLRLCLYWSSFRQPFCCRFWSWRFCWGNGVKVSPVITRFLWCMSFGKMV